MPNYTCTTSTGTSYACTTSTTVESSPVAHPQSILDEDGNPILDESGNEILDEGS